MYSFWCMAWCFDAYTLCDEQNIKRANPPATLNISFFVMRVFKRSSSSYCWMYSAPLITLARIYSFYLTITFSPWPVSSQPPTFSPLHLITTMLISRFLTVSYKFCTQIRSCKICLICAYYFVWFQSSEFIHIATEHLSIPFPFNAKHFHGVTFPFMHLLIDT